jgi:hypothetical protein
VVHIDPGGLLPHLGDDVARHVGEVGFRDDHQRPGTGVPRGYQGALQPVVGQGPVHRDDDAHDVHVRAEHLGL